MQFAEAVVDNFQGYRDAALIESAIAAARGFPGASEEVDELALAEEMIALAEERVGVDDFAAWLRAQIAT